MNWLVRLLFPEQEHADYWRARNAAFAHYQHIQHELATAVRAMEANAKRSDYQVMPEVRRLNELYKQWEKYWDFLYYLKPDDYPAALTRYGVVEPSADFRPHSTATDAPGPLQRV